MKIRSSFPDVFSELLAFLVSSDVRLYSQCGVKGFSEPYIVFVDGVVLYFPTSFLNVVMDIDDVDIIEPCDFVLYFDDERRWDGLLELVFDYGLNSFVGSKSSPRLIVFRFAP